MPYLGSTPNASFSSRTKQDFTANGSTTAFTLSSAVASANDIEVFVGNVRQEPTEAYTVNGTTLTMSEAPATGINFYVVFKGVEENSVVPADGTITDSKIVGMAASKLTGSLPAGSYDLNGEELILDADANTTITADTDNQVDIKVGGSDKVHVNQYGIGSGGVPISSDGSVIQATGNDGYSFRRSGQTNAGIIRPMAGSDDGMRFTVGGTGDRVVLDETNDKLYRYGMEKEHKKSSSNNQREVTGFFEISASTSNTTIFTVTSPTTHLGYFYEVICYGSDWSGHSSARALKRGFVNGGDTYTGHDQMDSQGPYAGNILSNVTWSGNTSTFKLRLDTGNVTLQGYVRLIGHIASYTII